MYSLVVFPNMCLNLMCSIPFRCFRLSDLHSRSLIVSEILANTSICLAVYISFKFIIHFILNIS